MERREMNLTFKIDGRELAKNVMNERIVKEMTLDERMKENKKKAIAISDELNRMLDRKVDWCVDGENVAEFHIYRDRYDYDVVKIKLLTQENNFYLTRDEYIDIIKYMLLERGFDNNLYTTYKAPTIEKVIVDLLEENECEDIYIFNNLLCYGDLEFCLEDIKEFYVYDDEECIMRIYDELDGWYIIDFINRTIQEECEV